MPPISFVFDRLISEVEARVGRAISRDEIEADPVNGLQIVKKAVKEVFGEPATREALVILSSIENIDEYLMDTRAGKFEEEVKVVIENCLYGIIDQRLSDLRNSVAAISFAAGFGPVANRLISLAETAAETFPASMWVSGLLVSETRDALERVLDRNGSRDDLVAVLRSTELLRGLLVQPNDKTEWKRHGIDVETVQTAVNDFGPYKEMLGLGFNLADDALTAISNLAESQLRPANKVTATTLAP
jgi:hypothetical protein